MDNKGPLEKFRYEGDALKPLMKVETFKDYKSNAIEFERYDAHKYKIAPF